MGDHSGSLRAVSFFFIIIFISQTLANSIFRLVSDSGIVKVGDFGMSTKGNARSSVLQAKPIKWSAPEVKANLILN